MKDTEIPDVGSEYISCAMRLMHLAMQVDLEAQILAGPTRMCAFASYYGPSKSLDIVVFVGARKEEYTVRLPQTTYEQMHRIEARLNQLLEEIHTVREKRQEAARRGWV